MLPGMVPMMAVGASGAFFRGATPLYTAAGAPVWPAGTSAGDIAVYHYTGNSNIAATAIPGWTRAGYYLFNNGASVTGIFWKVLTASDITSPPSMPIATSGNWIIQVLSGAATLVFKYGAGNQTGTSTPFGSFTPAANSRGAAVFAADRDPNDIAAIANWVSMGGGKSTYFGIRGSFKADYAGETIVVPFGSNNYYNQAALIVELTA